MSRNTHEWGLVNDILDTISKALAVRQNINNCTFIKAYYFFHFKVNHHESKKWGCGLTAEILPSMYYGLIPSNSRKQINQGVKDHT